MTKTNALSRRKMLGRIGLLAVAGYSVPALTTLSMAQAGNSGASTGSSANSAPSNSAPSNSAPSNSAPSNSAPSNSAPSVSGPSKSTVSAACGAEDLNNPSYIACLVTNGFPAP